MTDPTETARQFVARINQHDVAGLIQLMAPDHRLIDPGGVVLTGREQLQAAWRGYFRMVPDYWIALDHTLTQGDTVVFVGRAGGTYAPDGQLSPARRWQAPAAWRAVVQAGAVAEWQVYADNEPLRALMQREREPGSGAARQLTGPAQADGRRWWRCSEMSTRLAHPVLVFFGLSFMISGAAAGPLIASLHGLLPISLPPFLGLLAAVGPGLAALATAGLEDGRSGAWRLLTSATRWRVPAAWYVFVLLLPPVLLAATFSVHAALGARFPRLGPRLPELLPLWLILTLQTGLGEELGWRGLAQRRLQQRLGVLPAALVVGVVWSVWHLPLFLIPGSMQAQLSHAAGPLAGIGGYSAHLLLTAILYALVMNASGTVLMPMLLHGTTNATAWLFSLNQVERQGVRPMVVLTILEGLLVAAWLLWHRTIHVPSRGVTNA